MTESTEPVILPTNLVQVQESSDIFSLSLLSELQCPDCLWSTHYRAQFAQWPTTRTIMNVRNLIRKCRWHSDSPSDASYRFCLQGNWPISIKERGAETKSLGTFIQPDSYARSNPWCRNWIVLLQKVAIKSWEVLPRNKALKQIEWMSLCQNELPVS